MPPQESPADSTTPPIMEEKKKPTKIKVQRPKNEPPKTTQRGELVRKAAEDRILQEKISLNRQLEERRLKYEALMEKKKKEKESEPKKEEDKEDAKPAKAIKKTIPDWASTNSPAQKRMLEKKMLQNSKPKVLDIIIEAFKLEGEKSTLSGVFLKDYLKNYYPNNFKNLYGSGIKRALEKGVIKQVKGHGLSGSFKCLRTSAPTSKKASSSSTERPSLDSLMPHIFTWICEPKEASAYMIKKYLDKYYPKLASDGKGFKKALEHGVTKGQLERITGKGASGTFGLVDGAPKTGTRFEDPIEDAIIAMNEPKDASVAALKHYLSEYHTEYGIKERPYLLKKSLERLLQKGHLYRVSGKGFSGTFRLSYPYYPSPRDLWREEYESDEDDEPSSKPTRKKEIKNKLKVSLKHFKKGSSMPVMSNSSSSKSSKTKGKSSKVKNGSSSKKGLKKKTASSLKK